MALRDTDADVSRRSGDVSALAMDRSDGLGEFELLPCVFGICRPQGEWSGFLLVDDSRAGRSGGCQIPTSAVLEVGASGIRYVVSGVRSWGEWFLFGMGSKGVDAVSAKFGRR